jgi:predicted nucleotidyltransferase
MSAVDQNLEKLRALCSKHRVRAFYLFGSATRDDFDPQRSDLDFLVEFEPHERRGFDDVYFRLHADLERLFGRRVDLVEKGPLQRSRNYIRRDHILNTARMLYAA